MMLRLLLVVALLAASGASTSCRFFGRRKPVPAAPAVPKPEPPAAQIPASDPPPAQPQPSPQRPSPFPKPVPPEPRSEPARPAQPAPQLTEILTPAERDAYNRSIARSITQAERGLAALAGRTLTREQQAVADRARTFLQQAQQARQEDLVRAKGLADRAELLVEDLRKSVQ